MTRSTVLQLSVFFLILILCIGSSAAKSSEPPESSESDESSEGNDIVSVPSCCGFSTPLLIKKDQWKTIFETVYGHISTIQIGDGCGGMGPYKLHSITLEPNALLLPLLLHSDMVFFVDSGSGILNWVDLEKKSTEIKRGDVYRLLPGTVFYLQSKPVDIFLGTKLRLYAIFSNNEECLHDPCFGAYSSITDLLFGFDGTILKSAFGVPGDIIGLLNNRTKPPLIVHDMLTTPNEDNTDTWHLQPRLLKLFTGDVSADSVMGLAENKKKKKEKIPKAKKAKTFNVFESAPDFESPNGRSITINRNDLKVLKGSMVGVSMVNLTQGSMMGPHWNPWACEISIVLKGSGMVRVLRSSISSSSSECKNMRFKVEEGDIFAVPRLHPMAQMSFDNDSLVFVGFTTSAKDNEPQILAGKNSALWLLDRGVLAMSFNVSSVMIDGLLGAQKEAAMLDCPSCAEGELEKLKVEMETEKRDEERKKEEEEAKKEEEERKKREQEEEKKQRPPQPQQPSQPQQPPQPQKPPQPPQEEPQPWTETMRYDNKKKSEKKKKKKEEKEKKKHEDEEEKKKKKKKKPPQLQWQDGEEGENGERNL